MDCAGDVFQPGAHLQREREAGGKLRDTSANRLDPEHDMVVSAGDDTHKACLGGKRHRAPVGGEREVSGANFPSGALRLLRAKPDGNDLGIGEADRGDGALVPAPPVTGDNLGNHLALRHCPMRQHRLASHVADRIDPAHRGAALVVDADEGAVSIQVEFLKAPAVDGGLSPDGDEYFIGFKPGFATVRGLNRERLTAGGYASRLGAAQDAYTNRVQFLCDGPRELGIVLGQNARHRLDHHHLRAELREGGPELQTDIARTDDH